MSSARAGLFGFLLLMSAAPAYAQFGAPGIGADLSIELAPLHPGPGDTVQLTARSTSLDLSGATLLWQANGKTIAQGVGVHTATLVAGALGVETDVSVDAVTLSGTAASARSIIVASELDLLVGSDSFIPPFYRGRALPSAGTELLLQAIPRFKQPGKSLIPESELFYTWKKNGEVMGTISGRGKSTAHIPSPHLFGSDTVSVEVHSSDGKLSGETTLSVPSVEPILMLYENHPLYGIAYYRALPASTFIPESEMTFAATAYFAQVQSGNDSRLSFAWRVNDVAVVPSATHPSEITINADKSSGLAFVELELTHATNVYMDAKGSWNITFSANPSSQDQFHTFGQ